MKRILPLLAALLPFQAQAAELKMVTESYPPFNFREGDTYKGASVEQVRLLMEDAGIDHTMEMMPWARALFLAENHEMHCVFTTVHNQERDRRFKWVEPLLTSRTVLIRKSGSTANPKSLEEAKAFRVGTQRDDFTQTILEQNGFPRIDLAADLQLTLKKLMTGRIDLMPISEKYYVSLRRDGQPIEATLILAEDIYSIACNPSVPDELIGRMQKSLDKIIADGTQQRLFEKYGLASDQQE
ncbi:substrate-binding periplasmic protein [Sinorhizobium alkalisoli]|uniref:ABC transporter substrate-binding protein n=1 Tax=Sinorhizobium alkalisoli TaxID=1752398 RepID=A0A1E3VGP7_9HYPH|nr:transporter substrate-binding domain-containing protein [Sinorhizobium alkalisoli]ODR92745.1 ABC transporter substrate-binding protein [Sinorhizobium alkalisoli]